MLASRAKTFRLWLIRLLVITLTASIFMLSSALENSGWYGKLYVPLLLINSIGLLALSILTFLNLRDLILAVRHREPGARLTLRLVILFVILAALPVLVVFYFSLSFLHQRLDNWVNVEVGPIVTDALNVSRAAFDDNLSSALNTSQILVEKLRKLDNASAILELNDLRTEFGASVLTLISDTGHIIAFSSADTRQLLPYHPVNALNNMQGREYYMNLEPMPDKSLFSQVLIWATHQDSGIGDLPLSINATQKRLLQALYPTNNKINELAISMEERTNDYQQSAYLRQSLKLNVTLFLSLVLLMTLFSAAWGALVAARKLVAPVRDLAEGTLAVAEGNYEKQLPANRIGELGFLVESFNEMTRRLRKTHTALQDSRKLADLQLAYLEILLERLSSGVLSLDSQYRLRTHNAAAEQMLGSPLVAFVGKPIADSCSDYPALQTLCEAIVPNLEQDKNEWREQVTLFGNKGRSVLLCRGGHLPALSDDKHGYLIVLDDVTALIQGQRDAAWSEVARRLAHEIKNPLTPIRLSAERLRHKYLSTFPKEEINTLDRMTHTIIQQVESMQEMVNAFSNYARTPAMNWQKVDINALIEDVLTLYQGSVAKMICRLDNHLPEIDADPSRLRQVLHNLVKNAIEASEDKDNVQLTLVSKYHHQGNIQALELQVKDNGSGIPEELLDKIFEPYVTHKVKGTGLGLAIVKKIIQEHSGEVWIENQDGACILIRLPVQHIAPEHDV